MAAEIKTKSDETVTLIEGSGGIFEVERDSETLFSKKATGRFPTPGEVVQMLTPKES